MTHPSDAILPQAVEEQLLEQIHQLTVDASNTVFKDTEGNVSISGVLQGVFYMIECQAKRQAILSLVQASQEARNSSPDQTGVSP